MKTMFFIVALMMMSVLPANAITISGTCLVPCFTTEGAIYVTMSYTATIDGDCENGFTVNMGQFYDQWNQQCDVSWASNIMQQIYPIIGGRYLYNCAMLNLFAMMDCCEEPGEIRIEVSKTNCFRTVCCSNKHCGVQMGNQVDIWWCDPNYQWVLLAEDAFYPTGPEGYCEGDQCETASTCEPYGF